MPRTVIRHPGTGSLDERWRWAEGQAIDRRFRTFWIGYVIEGDPSGREWYYFDSHVSAITGKNTSSGRTRFWGPDTAGMHFSGVSLAPLVGGRAPHEVAVFLGYEPDRAGEPRLTRVHFANFALPAHFDRWPLIWIGAAGDTESIERVTRLEAKIRSSDLRRELVALTGVHRDSRTVVPILIRRLEDLGEPEGVRQEAAEWLGRHPERVALTTLTRTSRADRSAGVRREAVEALAHFGLESAADTLMDFVRTLDDRGLRRAAIEALGHRKESRVVDYLVGIVRDGIARDPGMDHRLVAVESLGGMEGSLGSRAVIDLARGNREPVIRRKAVEALGHADPPTQALDALLEIARGDADESVRVEAVETMAEVEDERAISMLRELADTHADAKVQLKAVEALGQAHPHQSAIDALGHIAHTHPRAAMQRKAAEAIGGFDDPRAVEVLVRIVETHPDVGVQVEAAEALGEVHPHEPALAALRRIARDHPRPEVRRKAVEGLGAYAER